MSDLGVAVAPMSRAAIRHVATGIREQLLPSRVELVRVERLLELVVPDYIEDFVLNILEREILKDAEGLAMPSKRCICIRDDVYDRMCCGDGRARFTGMHEFAHIVMHTPDRVVYQRNVGKQPAYRDPEWQADTFAREFLMPYNRITAKDTAQTLMERFGVSRRAAEVQLNVLFQDGLLKLV